ncbi:MAG: pyridoxamine 5'-phosphate oxidase family protein [Planctomycetota bacterium]|jgi:uncharacterized protein YhbP (UPF0306 family)
MEPTPEQLPAILETFLAGVPTLGLATADGEGRPHAANLNFVAEAGLNLLFLSSPAAAHSRHLAARPEVAVTAYAPFDSVEQIRGVQMHGVCAVMGPEEFDAAWAAFCAKFPYAAGMEEAVRAEESFYRFRPRWVRWIDNAVRFRFKLEAEWPLPR